MDEEAEGNMIRVTLHQHRFANDVEGATVIFIHMHFIFSKYVSWFVLLLGMAVVHAVHAASTGRPLLQADPTVFFFEGTYYLYGTDKAGQGFEVYTSKDLQRWAGPQGKRDGFALRKGESFGQRGFWAPQVFYHRGKFYMAYTADEQIALATSDSPLGPFTQNTPRKISGDTRQIDPFVFFDDDGKIYLYHVRLDEGNKLYVAEMRSDLSDIKPKTLRPCLKLDQQWEDTGRARWPVMEGPTVIKHGKHYYLFYSANDFRSPDYAVGYAVAPTALGPWKKPSRQPLLSRHVIDASGPGHGDLFKDAQGAWRYVFHVHASPVVAQPRRTAMVTIRFVRDSGREAPQLVENSLVYLAR